MYSFFTNPATVKRQTYTANKSTFATTGNVYKGYFKPTSLNDLIDREMFGKEFHFSTFYDVDIQEGDRLVIESVEYNVKAVNKKKALSNIQYTLCLLVNDQN